MATTPLESWQRRAASVRSRSAREARANGVFRFRLGPSHVNGAALDLAGAHLLGTDGVPTRGELRLNDSQVFCDARNGEPTALSLLWPVSDYGVVQLETTRLPARNEPYLLPLELTRHRLMRMNMKREEWGLFDYPGMEDVSNKIEHARKQIIQA